MRKFRGILNSCYREADRNAATNLESGQAQGSLAFTAVCVRTWGFRDTDDGRWQDPVERLPAARLSCERRRIWGPPPLRRRSAGLGWARIYTPAVSISVLAPMAGASPTTVPVPADDSPECENPAGCPGVSPVPGSLDLEEALRRERSLLRTIIDSIPALIYAKDIESRFIACNVLAARGMGTTPRRGDRQDGFRFLSAGDGGRVLPGRAGGHSVRAAAASSARSRSWTAPAARPGSMPQPRCPTGTRPATSSASWASGATSPTASWRTSASAICASHDSLTDLPNRSSFSEALSERHRGGRGDQQPLRDSVRRPGSLQVHQRLPRSRGRRHAAEGEWRRDCAPACARMTSWRVSVATSSFCCAAIRATWPISKPGSAHSPGGHSSGHPAGAGAPGRREYRDSRLP